MDCKRTEYYFTVQKCPAILEALLKSWHWQEGGGGGRGSDLCQDFSGGFDGVYKGQPKVIMDP